MRRSALSLLVAATSFELLLPRTAHGQLAPTGAHYAGRASDTGYGGMAVPLTGRAGASIPLDLPTARAGLPIPLQIVYGGHGVGTAGLGWDIPLSYIQQRRTFAHRRPTYGQYILPQPRQRTILSLLGQEAELVPHAGSWVVRAGTLELQARESNGAWLVYDGAGRTYRFVQPAQLANTGLWLLETIDAAGGARLRLTYQLATLPVAGGSALGIDLVRLAYNTHPATGCAKHEIALTYGDAAATPFALSFLGEKPLVRNRVVESVDVMSRATCNTALQRLRRYELRYEPDADTRLARLQRVRMFGRQGTPEEQVALPIASYRYGSATRDGKLRYNVAQTIALPPDSDGAKISGSAVDSSVNAPGSGERYATWQSLTDVTGDGRPDLILKKSGKLWVALNHPTVGGKTALGGVQGLGQLQDAVFQSGAFSTHGETTRRFWYAAQNNDAVTVSDLLQGAFVAANHNVVDEWRQSLDVNGDGRLDVIDAAAEPMRWVIYLNTPGGSGIGGVKWVRRTVSVSNLALELTSRGHKLSGNRVPLARRSTSGAVKVSTCWRWIESESRWKWFDAWGEHCFGDPTRVLDRGPERTITEWQLADVNGDGYPDFVYDSTPVRFQLNKPDPPVGGQPTVRYGDVWVWFAPAATNAVRAAYNVVGARLRVNETSPFARSVTLEAPSPESGVELWEAAEGTVDNVQRQTAAVRDVNGDGLADRVVGTRAYLGVYIGTARAFSTVHLTLPGVLSEQVSKRDAQCAAGPRFTSRLTRGLRDLTGDGIPDYYAGGRVSIGTGAGFTPPVDVVSGVDFQLSHQTESCDGQWSNTDGGLFDIDADGQPEVIGIVSSGGTTSYLVSQLAGSTGPRAPEAGRLIAVDNGYGATSNISYASAKDDRHSTHHVPFSEIVVSAVRTTGTLGLGGTLGGSRYAYGNATLLFDPAFDGFVFPGYQREVEVRSIGGDREEGLATVIDRWPLTPFSIALTKREHWLRTQRVGRLRDLYVLRASHTPDPAELLGISVNDTRVIGVTHQEWDARLFAPPPGVITRDCLEMVEPYDWDASVLGNLLDACRAHGFVFGTSTDAYRGASPPPSSNNVQTQLRVLEVDDFGRATKTEYRGDRFRSDDDVCIESRYPTPVHAHPRVLTAPASERVTDCKGRLTYARQAWRYDGLATGLVSEGRVTSHFVQRRATDNGALVRAIRRFDATYDGAGNVASVSTHRDGATRTASFEHDPFGLVLTRTRVTGSGVPSSESSTTLDPVSLDALVETDANDTQRGAEFDGFGRLVRSSAMPPGGQPGVRAALTYLGYDDGNPSGRRVMVKGFADPVPAAMITAIPGRTTTIFLDELGRERRTEVDLGSDYGNEVLVVDAREYDVLGRVAFEADAYPSSANPTTPYGTTYHYKRDGEPACFIRGYGRQALTTVPDVATERFPTCFQRSFDNHVDTLEVQDAASLEPGSSQNGVKRRIVTSAIGRPIEHSTLKGATRLDHATFTHDRLGQLTSMTRYLEPVGGTGPVRWSWRLDSIGQVLRFQEPAAATRFYSYSDWGEMVEARWSDGGVDRRMVRRFDALGRLVAAEERNDGIVDPETVHTYAYDVGVPSPHLSPTFVLGRLSWASAPTGAVTFSYDAYGRVNARVFTDDSNQAYVQRSEHHADGRLATIDFELPDANFKPERVKYAYDSADRLRSVSYADASGSRELYRADVTDALGRVRESTHGDTRYHADYPGAGRDLLTEAAIESAQGARAFLFLGYDAVGREQGRREIANGAASGPKLNVGYDALGRLSSALRTDGATTLGSRNIAYDALGNVLALEDAVGNLDATLSYDVTDRDRICRIGYGSGGLGGTACNVLHDAVGNVVSQPTRNGTRQLAYFNSGAVRSIDQQGAHARFRYDPFGQIQELDVTGTGIQDTRRDRRFGALIERRDETTGGTTTSVILRHVPGPAGILVTRRGNGDDWIFEFGEQRGRRVFTSEDGAFVQDVDYEPFGESTSSGAAPGTTSYTSYQWNEGDALAAFGLSHLGARLYDPVIGRFLSRDPIRIPRSASLTNPYAFAMNDPLNASDPSGLQPGEEPEPWTPLLPFDFGGAAPSGPRSPTSPPSPPPPDPWDLSVHESGDPAIAQSLRTRRLELTIAVLAGSLTKAAASNAFRDFVRKQIYTSQRFWVEKSVRAVGFCAAASRQMALKHGGIIQSGLSRDAIKKGLNNETSSRASKEGQWYYWHFNETVKIGEKPLFSHPSKLHPDAIARIARNPAVGTGSTSRLRWTELTADEARDFLDEGALVVVGTTAHWLAIVRDPFSGDYVYLDPYATTHAGQLLTSGSMSQVPRSPEGQDWGNVAQYHALVHE